MKSIKTLFLWCCLLAVPFGLETAVLTTAQAQKNFNDAVAALKNDPNNPDKAQKVIEAYESLKAPSLKAAADATLKRTSGKTVEQVKEVVVKAKTEALKAKGIKDADARTQAEVQEFIDNANFILKLLKDDAAIQAETDAGSLQEYNASLQSALVELNNQRAKNKLLSELADLEKRLNAHNGQVITRIANLTIPAPVTPPAAPKISSADLQKVIGLDTRLAKALQQDRQMETIIEDHKTEKFAFTFSNYQEFSSRVSKLQNDFDSIAKFIRPLPALLEEFKQIVVVPHYDTVDESRRKSIINYLAIAQKIFDDGSVALLTIIKEQIKVALYLTSRISRAENLEADTKIGNINLTALWANAKTLFTGNSESLPFPKGTDLEQIKKLADSLKLNINRNITDFESITGRVFRNEVAKQQIFLDYVDNFLAAGSLIDLLKPAPVTPGVIQRPLAAKPNGNTGVVPPAPTPPAAPAAIDQHDKDHLDEAKNAIEASKTAITDAQAKEAVFNYNLAQLNAALSNLQDSTMTSAGGKQAAVSVRAEVQKEIDRITALQAQKAAPSASKRFNADMFASLSVDQIEKRMEPLFDENLTPEEKNIVNEALDKAKIGKSGVDQAKIDGLKVY